MYGLFNDIIDDGGESDLALPWTVEDRGLATGAEECPLATSLPGHISRSSRMLDLPGVEEKDPDCPRHGGGVVPASHKPAGWRQ